MKTSSKDWVHCTPRLLLITRNATVKQKLQIKQSLSTWLASWTIQLLTGNNISPRSCFLIILRSIEVLKRHHFSSRTELNPGNRVSLKRTFEENFTAKTIRMK